MISTISMIRLGKVYQNYMVDLIASNEKLEQRAVTIVAKAAETGEEEAKKALTETGGDVKAAIIRIKTGLTPEKARQILRENNGVLRKALEKADVC
jgi:N-acetylmuramic acid 6-phosphate etherase